MSASPVGMPNGRPQPPKGVPPLRRKPKAADPLVARKKPKQKPKPAPPPPPAENSNGFQTLFGAEVGPAQPTFLTASLEMEYDEFKVQRAKNGGWTDPPPPNAQNLVEFPVYMTKRSLPEDIGYHVMKLTKAAKGGDLDENIDPTDHIEFTRPVSLYRRDPRLPPPARAAKEEETTPAPVDDEEAKRLAQLKADKEAQRAADMAQVAPSVKENKKKTRKQDKPFMRPIVTGTKDRTAENDLRYNESRPWHLEDADGKNVWVGSYVAALSQANVALMLHGDGFRMVPLDKYYRFVSKPPFKALTTDEAEVLMNKRVDPGRWELRDQLKKEFQAELESTRNALGGRVRVNKGNAGGAARKGEGEINDFDMEGEEFQDDDENVGLEPDNDEEAKESRERVRQDNLSANTFDVDEIKVEQENEKEELLEFLRKNQGKRYRKALTKRERQKGYESEDDHFLSSDSSDEEDEKENDEKKKDEDSKDKDGKTGTIKGETSTAKPLPLDKKAKSLKRPGSPNLSESSEAETSRKKVKKEGGGSHLASRSGTPLPGQGRTGGKSGAASDGEGTAGEMSDGGTKPRKIKLIGTGGRNTPVGSRAGSPVPSSQRAGSGSPARAASPIASPIATPTNGDVAQVTGPEIAKVMGAYPEGITVAALLKEFTDRVGESDGQMPRKNWIKIVKHVCNFGPDKKLRLKKSG